MGTRSDENDEFMALAQGGDPFAKAHEEIGDYVDWVRHYWTEDEDGRRSWRENLADMLDYWDDANHELILKWFDIADTVDR